MLSETMIAEALRHRLEVVLASLQGEPGVPALEVFERPGWTVICAHNTRALRLPVPAPPAQAVGHEEYKPPRVIDVTPVVYGRTDLATYGLGFCVETRQFVLFRYSARRDR